MPRLPRVTADQVMTVLARRGFAVVRKSKGHIIYRDAAGRRVTVAYHAGTILKLKTFKSILRQAGLTAEEFDRLLKGT